MSVTVRSCHRLSMATTTFDPTKAASQSDYMRDDENGASGLVANILRAMNRHCITRDDLVPAVASRGNARQGP
jgi:hypothetical protein